MLVETDYCYPSGQGTAMYSRRGVETIQFHLCFRTTQMQKYQDQIKERQHKAYDSQVKFRSMSEIKAYLNETCHTSSSQLSLKKKPGGQQSSAEDLNIAATTDGPSGLPSELYNQGVNDSRCSYIKMREGTSPERYNPGYSQIFKRVQGHSMHHRSVREEIKEQIKVNIKKRKEKEQLMQQQALLKKQQKMLKEKNEHPKDEDNQDLDEGSDENKAKHSEGLKRKNTLSQHQPRFKSGGGGVGKDMQQEGGGLKKANNMSLRTGSGEVISEAVDQEGIAEDLDEPEFSFRKHGSKQHHAAVAGQSFSRRGSSLLQAQKQQHQYQKKLNFTAHRLSVSNGFDQANPYELGSSTLEAGNKTFYKPALSKRNFASRNITQNYLPSFDTQHLNSSGGINDSCQQQLHQSSHMMSRIRHQYQSYYRASNSISISYSRSMVDMEKSAGRSKRSIKTQKTETRLERLNKLRENQLLILDKNIKRFSSKILSNSQGAVRSKQLRDLKNEKQKDKLFKLLGFNISIVDSKLSRDKAL